MKTNVNEGAGAKVIRVQFASESPVHIAVRQQLALVWVPRRPAMTHRSSR